MVTFQLIMLVYGWWGASGVYIAYRDHEFVGEDPVLAAELQRRMARIQPPPDPRENEQPDIPPPRAGQVSPGSVPTPPQTDPRSVNESMLRAQNESMRRLFGLGWIQHAYKYWDLERAAGKIKGIDKGHEGKYEEFEKDWTADNLYAMQLKVAEQAIYGLQYRLDDLDKIVGRYNASNLMRIAYTLKRLDFWYDEMRDFYEYSHKPYEKTPINIWILKFFEEEIPIPHDTYWTNRTPYSAENPWYFPNIRHIYYYQEIQKRYINMIYSIEFVRKLHAEEIAKYLEEEAKKPKPENNTASTNDTMSPDMANMLLMMSKS